MKIIATPRLRRAFMRSKRCSVSSGVSAAVGSSKMITRASLSTARAISTICRLAADSAPASCDGSTLKLRRWSAWRAVFRTPRTELKARSRPSTMFCATVSWGTRLVSWKTIAMP